MTVTRDNPYESPRPIPTDDSHPGLNRFLPSRVVVAGIAFAPLVGTTAWAIYHVSPIGVFLPGSFALVAAMWFMASVRITLLSTTLAYVLGVSTILLATVVTDSIFDPMQLNDDGLRFQVTRVWSGCGILGAVTGAMIGIRIGNAPPPQNRTEP